MKNSINVILISVVLFAFISCAKKSNPAGPADTTATATRTVTATATTQPSFSATTSYTASFTSTCTETETVFYTETKTPSSTETMTPTATGTMTPRTPPAAGIYRMRIKHSNYYVDLEGGGMSEGTNIYQWEPNASDNQRWIIEQAAPPYYRIVSVVSGNVADVAGVSYDNGANIHSWHWAGTDNQLWLLVDTYDGAWNIQSKLSGKNWDVQGAQLGSGANIYQWDAHAGDNQRFFLESAENTASPTATPTVTVTCTSTPEYGTITGSIIMPAPQPGVVWQVMVDNNMTYSDGVENAAMNVCGALASVPYSITASAGTHYVYAIVKNESDILALPIAGDHVGIYGAVYPAFPASANVVAAANTNTTDIDITVTLAVNNVSGTITLPASADLRNITMVLDNDANAYNGGHIYLAGTEIPTGTGTTIPYNILIVFPGAWYIHAVVENDYYGQLGQFLPPVTGDFTGVSGPHVLDPAVPNTGYDFTLTVY